MFASTVLSLATVDPVGWLSCIRPAALLAYCMRNGHRKRLQHPRTVPQEQAAQGAMAEAAPHQQLVEQRWAYDVCVCDQLQQISNIDLAS